MRKTLTSILLLTITVSFSQTEKDLTEIIELVIEEYQSDTIAVYYKFNNYKLLSDLDKAKSYKDSKIQEKYGNKLDSKGNDLNWEIKAAAKYDDTVTLRFDKINVEFFPAIKIIDKKDNKRIQRFTKIKLINNKRKPIAYISYPLISKNQKKAIVYGSYVCGGLCGSGGIFYLENINGRWILIKYERRWVA